MCNQQVQSDIHDLFQSFESEIQEIIQESPSIDTATERITRLVSSKLTTETEGYIVDIYTALTEQIRKEEYFQDPEHLNAFYRLNLRDEMNEKYHFEIDNLDAYCKGIQFREINQLYMTAGAAAGTLAVGGVLKFALSGVVGIPFAIIIAGAIAAALAAFRSVPQKNKKNYELAVKKYLSDLENDVLDWIIEVEGYFQDKVRTLYTQN